MGQLLHLRLWTADISHHNTGRCQKQNWLLVVVPDPEDRDLDYQTQALKTAPESGSSFPRDPIDFFLEASHELCT